MEKKMNISAVIGIDPGRNGGIAIYIQGTNAKVAKMPKDIAELRDFFAYYRENYRPLVFLEKLSIRPDDITSDDKGTNMGKLYRIQKMMANFEHLKAMMEAEGVPYVMVHPMTWQTKLKLRERGEKEDKAVRKRRYCAVAAKFYPSAKVTLWNADALLIMHFGRWAVVNDTQWVRSNLPQAAQSKLF